MQAIKKKKVKNKRRPTVRALQVVNNMVENGGNVSKAMRDSGMSAAYSKNPQKFIASETVQDLLTKAKITLSDDILISRHASLLNAHKLEHMVFPLGPDSAPDEDFEEDEDNPMPPSGESIDLSDEDIINMLAEVNCTVRKIVHGEQARHVYFWAADNKAQHSALELAYDLRGYLKKDTNPKGLVIPIQVNIDKNRSKYE